MICSSNVRNAVPGIVKMAKQLRHHQKFCLERLLSTNIIYILIDLMILLIQQFHKIKHWKIKYWYNLLEHFSSFISWVQCFFTMRFSSPHTLALHVSHQYYPRSPVNVMVQLNFIYCTSLSSSVLSRSDEPCPNPLTLSSLKPSKGSGEDGRQIGLMLAG